MAQYMVNEVLCVLFNNFGKMPKADIVRIFAEFYTEEEISAAKMTLYDIAETLQPKADELKAVKKTRVGDGRVRREVEDLLLIYSVLDARKHKLPLFYAANSSRVPSLQDFEICKLTACITAIKDSLEVVGGNVSAVLDASAGIPDIKDSLEVVSGNMAAVRDASVTTQTNSSSFSATTPNPLLSADSAPSHRPTSNQDQSLTNGNMLTNYSDAIRLGSACQATNSGTDRSSWHVQHNKRERRRITGANKSVKIDSGNRDIPKAPAPKFWHIFVSRMSKDVLVNDVTELLSNSGINVNKVTKLEAKMNWQKKFSAFRVSIDVKQKNDVMNPDIWPEDVDVRDWIFTKKDIKP